MLQKITLFSTLAAVAVALVIAPSSGQARGGHGGHGGHGSHGGAHAAHGHHGGGHFHARGSGAYGSAYDCWARKRYLRLC